jgi:hypothetical protein
MGWHNIPLLENYYYKFERGVIPKGVDNRIGRAIWDVDGNALYLTCAQCGTINRCDRGEFFVDERYGSYLISPCVLCIKCDSHIWVSLTDWESVSIPIRQKYMRTVYG